MRGIGVAKLMADLRDGVLRIQEKVAGVMNTAQLEVMHGRPAGGAPERLAEVIGRNADFSRQAGHPELLRVRNRFLHPVQRLPDCGPELESHLTGFGADKSAA